MCNPFYFDPAIKIANTMIRTITAAYNTASQILIFKRVLFLLLKLVPDIKSGI